MGLLCLSQVFGHDKVSVLDGGLPKWTAEGGETVSGVTEAVEVCLSLDLSFCLSVCLPVCVSLSACPSVSLCGVEKS